ncbi:exonuclease [Arthrobacter phage DanielleIgnace]|nr:exonuclease [Arthrobacter phage DanielleIgnace]
MATRAALAFIDCETTGLNEEIDQIWEVGLILRGPGHGINDEQHLTIHVEGITKEMFHPDARAIGRFDERYGLDAQVLTRHQTAYALSGWLADRHLVGANPAFDQAFLKRLLRTSGIGPTWKHRLIDVENLVMQDLNAPTPMGLRQSAEAEGVYFDPEYEHTAYGDALTAMKLYDLCVHGVVPAGRPQ